MTMPKKALLTGLLAATVLSACTTQPLAPASDFPPLGLEAMEATLNARLAAQASAPPAPVAISTAAPTAASAPTPVRAASLAAQAPAARVPASVTSAPASPVAAPELQSQVAFFRSICGVLARTGDLSSTQAAALGSGFQVVGTSSNRAYGFSNLTVLDNNQGTQIQLSATPGFGTLTSREALCSVVSQGSGGTQAAFDTAGSAIAADNGVPLEAETFGAFGFDEFGKAQFRVPNRIVRLDWQDRPFGLVLYTLRD